MKQHLIRRQIASLEAQVLSLRDSIAMLPADQRELDAADIQRVRGALAQLNALLNTITGDRNRISARPADLQSGAHSDDGELVWTAQRTTRLYAINTGLSVALTQTQAAQVVLDQALPALSADAGVIMLSVDGTLKPLDAAGRDAASIGPVVIDDLSPFGQAARTAEAVWIETPEELGDLYGIRSDMPWSGAGAVGAVPLIAEDRVLGVMAFRFDRARPFSIADRAFMLVLAQQCSAALERVHLYEQVRQAAAVQERNRLARDLHDSVSQALYAIVLAVSVGRANLSKDLSRVTRALDNIESLTGAAQADLRALLFDLRGDSVARTGLVNALIERAQFLRLRHNLAVRTELCEEPPLGTLCKDALYGIAREALHNSAKHARANQVEIRLTQSPETLTLEITDDGIGFEPANVRPGRYGLQSMRERASELGAEFRVESVRGQGTRVAVVVPLVNDPVNGQEWPPCSSPA